MSLVHLARAALSMPPQVVARKAARLAGRLLKDRLVGGMMRRQCTYPASDQAGGALTRRLAALDPALVDPRLRETAERARRNEFDLLGSGWVTVERGRAYAGFGQWKYPPGRLTKDWRQAVVAEAWPGNQTHMAFLLAMIDDPAYRPIDWHADFKSGYRWPLKVWGASTAYAHKPGVDVKVPWELARLQHLPQMALVFAADRDPAWKRTFRNQVLDFLAANPPGWGVNWACAMDVAIRAANLVMAWDLFRAHGAEFDQSFEDELAAALLAHGRHVTHHLEWNPEHRGNHYLADIAGLAFIAAALPGTPETDLWLVFAAQELDAEILRQFGPDGANFEASTAYHRLSAEMALYAVALILGLPEDRRAALAQADIRLWKLKPAITGPFTAFSEPVFARLAAAARFAEAVTKPSGAIVQIGDNDSGRFFKLVPHGDLDVSHLTAAAQGLFDLGAAPTVETAIVAQLAGRRVVADSAPARRLDGEVLGPEAARMTRIIIAPEDGSALDGLEPLAYPDFGLFIWKNARTFLSVRCGPIGANGLGAHAHNDQLAVEIEIDGAAFARDPGTFVYTPDLAERTRYRSALAHFVPRHGEAEPARLDLGPFALEDRAQAQALRFAEGEFVGTHGGFGEPVWRRVLVGDGAVVIEDCWGGPAIGRATQVSEHMVRNPDELAALWNLTLPFSPGYGRKEPV